MNTAFQATLNVVVALGSGLIAGTFFAFSVFVMRALQRLPFAQGVAAMQSINIVVINPVFLSAFLGTGLAWVVLLVTASIDAHPVRSLWSIAGAILYLGGCVLVTMARNVPLNNMLAGLAAGSTEASRFWPEYVTRWMFWNHVRTAASLSASACCLGILQ